MIETVTLAKVTPGDNLRREMTGIDELAATIAEVGLLQPLVVTVAGDGTYRLVAGHRRYAACIRLGLADVAVDVRDFDDAEVVLAMVIENLQRQDLAPLEEADGYRRLAELGLSQRAIAARAGTTQANVSRKLALLALPDDLRSALDTSRITVDAALRLLQQAKAAAAEPALPPAPPLPTPPPAPARRGQGQSVLFAGRRRTVEGIAARRRRQKARAAALAALAARHRPELDRLLAEQLGAER